MNHRPENRQRYRAKTNPLPMEDGMATNQKHTPGPWVAEADDDSDLGEFTVRTADGDYIADVRNPYCDYDMQVAYAQSDDCRIEHDARLIAAAPELADCIHDLLYLHEAHHNHPLHAAARALLAKAGSQS